MLLQIKYFGMLTDITGCTNENLEFSGTTTGELLAELFTRYPGLSSKDFKVAVNQHIVAENAEINHNEVALLPPFSGG